MAVNCKSSVSISRDLFQGSYSKDSFPSNLRDGAFRILLKAFPTLSRKSWDSLKSFTLQGKGEFRDGCPFKLIWAWWGLDCLEEYLFDLLLGYISGLQLYPVR